MQTDEILGILVRRHPLTETEWKLMIEGRLNMIKSDLRSMPLTVLGEVRVGNNLRIGQEPCSRGGDTGLSLMTKGVFTPPHMECGFPPTGTGDGHAVSSTYKFCGVTRDGKWVTVEVYSTWHDDKDEKNRSVKVQRVQNVNIWHAPDLVEMCKFCSISLELVWKTLGEFIRLCAKQREDAHNEAVEWLNAVDQEEKLVDAIPKPLVE